MLMHSNFLKFSTVLLLLFFHASSAAMVQKPHKQITFQGETKYLMHLLLQSEFCNTHPFAHTRVVRMDNDKCVKGGTVLNLTNDDYQQIAKQEYIYLDNYISITNRFSLSLLIIGTTDKTVLPQVQL